MVKQGYPNEFLTSFDFVKLKGGKPEPIIAIIQQMDRLLTKEQCLAIMEKQGCSKVGSETRTIKHLRKVMQEKRLPKSLL